MESFSVRICFGKESILYEMIFRMHSWEFDVSIFFVYNSLFRGWRPQRRQRSAKQNDMEILFDGRARRLKEPTGCRVLSIESSQRLANSTDATIRVDLWSKHTVSDKVDVQLLSSFLRPYSSTNATIMDPLAHSQRPFYLFECVRENETDSTLSPYLSSKAQVIVSLAFD